MLPLNQAAINRTDFVAARVSQKAPAFRTADLELLLERAHPSREWALLFQVPPRTGGGTRYADAVALNLWKSRGYALHGFELKASRSDWLRELKQPEKSEEIIGSCDYFWVVAAPDIVRVDELPPGWGLLEPAPARRSKEVPDKAVARTLEQQEEGHPDRVDTSKWVLRVSVKAERLKAKPLGRELFASLMRRAAEGLDDAVARKTATERERIRLQAEERIDYQVQQHTARAQKYEQMIIEFKTQTGLEFTPWRGPSIEIIQLAQRLHDLDRFGDSGVLLEQLDRLCSTLEKSACDIRQVIGTARQTFTASASCSNQTSNNLQTTNQKPEMQ